MLFLIRWITLFKLRILSVNLKCILGWRRHKHPAETSFESLKSSFWFSAGCWVTTGFKSKSVTSCSQWTLLTFSMIFLTCIQTSDWVQTLTRLLVKDDLLHWGVNQWRVTERFSRRRVCSCYRYTAPVSEQHIFFLFPVLSWVWKCWLSVDEMPNWTFGDFISNPPLVWMWS